MARVRGRHRQHPGGEVIRHAHEVVRSATQMRVPMGEERGEVDVADPTAR